MTDVAEHPFARTAGPYERDVLAACYRMAGSLGEARDLLGRTWQRAEREYADQVGPVREWLHGLAVEVAVEALSGQDGRPLPTTIRPASDAPEGDLDERFEVLWLEPIPDEVLGPASTGVSLAEVTALQQLPVADRAALVRARRSVLDPSPALSDAEELSLLERWAAAFEAYDVDAISALLEAEAVWEMPPFAGWFRGRSSIERLIRTACPAEGPGDQVMVPVRANGQPGFALYMRDRESGKHRAFQIQVLTLTPDGVSHAVAFFDRALFAAFGLPELLGRR